MSNYCNSGFAFDIFRPYSTPNLANCLSKNLATLIMTLELKATNKMSKIDSLQVSTPHQTYQGSCRARTVLLTQVAHWFAVTKICMPDMQAHFLPGGCQMLKAWNCTMYHGTICTERFSEVLKVYLTGFFEPSILCYMVWLCSL